ncbi:hypothetical protein C4D60_Mb01t12440 [Musa balbisiana]|uniref:Uncharacterized protein n=1 Tax=Musa balbisiana TaxID=52838 RepID=A0A4V4H7A9_MUSBA|nr:hypothetical protein C4D60_Mb01t12440 [Musa balbisiana]
MKIDEMLSRDFNDQIYEVYIYLPPELQFGILVSCVFSSLAFGLWNHKILLHVEVSGRFLHA